ncbi:eCIS core domain-containing protein [Streptomyces sp. NPDC054796]
MAPQALRDLQRSAGNAAVVQMLRRSGHRTEEQPEVPEVPEVQRSAAVRDVLRSGGRPLDNATRTDMEARLGADFSDVRVHSGSAAKASATELGARAYTSGNHIVIGDGGADAHTLAHELTHVIQQRQGPVAGTDNGGGLKVSDPSDRFEREAEANARRVMARRAPETADRPREDSVQLRPGHPGHVAQRMEVTPQERDAFLATHNPRNQVILNASLNGVDLGLYASAAQSHDRTNSDHAEDAILDLLETLAWSMPDVLQASNTLDITALTASPCTTIARTDPQTGAQLPITSRKGSAGSTDGCAERLIELQTGGLEKGDGSMATFQISVACAHYYQPAKPGAKEASRQAVAAMQAAGITVTVTNP